MKVTWSVSDGTTVTYRARGVIVEGEGAFATKLRRGLASAKSGLGPSVDVLPPPGGSVPLDPASPWLVDLWVRASASAHRLTVITAYLAPRSDAPPAARELLAMEWESKEGVIY